MEKIKRWLKEHKKEIIVGGIVAGVGGVIFYKQGQTIKVLKESIYILKEDKAALKMDNILKDLEITELKELCEAKDESALGIFSDGLRHGSSLCGQALADRKAFLKAA